MGIIKSTIVGSYPKPKNILGNIIGHNAVSTGHILRELEKNIGTEEYKKLLDDAVNNAIKDQEDARIDIISDGEQRRGHYVKYVLRGLTGFDFENMVERKVEKLIDGTYHVAYSTIVPTVNKKIDYKNSITVQDFLYLKERTKKEIKMALPGPSTVVDSVDNKFYNENRELAFDYAKSIKKEVVSLRDAGCKIIQFDDPGLLRDIRRSEDWGIKALESCFEGIDVTTIVHVCRSYPDKELEEKNIKYKSDQEYYPELLRILKQSKVDQISIEGKQGNLNPVVLKDAGDKKILLGCIDVGNERVESVEEIIEQAKNALKYLRPKQLILAPDCGLLELSKEAAKAKLTNMAKAAEILNSELK